MTKPKAAEVLVIVRGMALHASGDASVGVMRPPEASHLHGWQQIHKHSQRLDYTVLALLDWIHHNVYRRKRSDVKWNVVWLTLQTPGVILAGFDVDPGTRFDLDEHRIPERCRLIPTASCAFETSGWPCNPFKADIPKRPFTADIISKPRYGKPFYFYFFVLVELLNIRGAECTAPKCALP